MKKICLFLVCLLCFSFFANAVSAKEMTLNQLLKEAEANRKAYAEAKNQKAVTEEEKRKATMEKQAVEADIKEIENSLASIEKDIENLQKSIEKKDEEIKELMSFVQVSNSDSMYLEYIFGASSFTDFIYRISVAEELSDYNDKLIKEYDSDVKKLSEKQESLNKKQTELNNKQHELNILEARLSEEIENITEGMQTKEQEYQTQINTINSMRSMGCSENETESACKNRIFNQVKPSGNSSGGNITVPNSHGTYMPIAKGTLTSDYGWRTGEFHTGMDFASGIWGEPVYPVAGGKVINIDRPRYSGECGNIKVYVLHNINGVAYTTSYWHLISVSVSVGQDVSATTQIGTIAGRGYVDECAFGGHVHLNLFRGYTTNNSGRINPRTIIPQAPSAGSYFSHR